MLQLAIVLIDLTFTCNTLEGLAVSLGIKETPRTNHPDNDNVETEKEKYRQPGPPLASLKRTVEWIG